MSTPCDDLRSKIAADVDRASSVKERIRRAHLDNVLSAMEKMGIPTENAVVKMGFVVSCGVAFDVGSLQNGYGMIVGEHTGLWAAPMVGVFRKRPASYISKWRPIRRLADLEGLL